MWKLTMQILMTQYRREISWVISTIIPSLSIWEIEWIILIIDINDRLAQTGCREGKKETVPMPNLANSGYLTIQEGSD